LFLITGCSDNSVAAGTSDHVAQAIATDPQAAELSLAEVVAVAEKLADSIKQSNADTLVYELDTPTRANWSNLPANIYRRRNGVRIGNMNAEQLNQTFSILQATLSADGYTKVMQLLEAEKVLGEKNSGRGGGLAWSADNYYFATYGTPSVNDAWAWQFGGHHLAINMMIKGEERVMSPNFIGVEPASYTSNGETIRPMGAEVDLPLAIIKELSDELRSEITLNDAPRDLYAGAGNDDTMPPLMGGNVGKWSPEVQVILRDLIAQWVGLLPQPQATARLAEIEADFSKTFFAWYGESDGSSDTYYQIQGPTLLIEFSTEGNLGSTEGHLHSIYRNLSDDYGKLLIGK
jgi:hypothetical protein